MKNEVKSLGTNLEVRTGLGHSRASVVSTHCAAFTLELFET